VDNDRSNLVTIIRAWDCVIIIVPAAKNTAASIPCTTHSVVFIVFLRVLMLYFSHLN
jgi:hypothetical protein